MHVKLYYCHTKNIDINYLKIINDLIENLVDKVANQEIPMPLNYLELEKLC